MKTFDLRPNKGQKSFYGKARVNQYVNDNGETISDLISYQTKVASYNHSTNKMIVNGWYSATTARHINAFLSLHEFDQCTKKQLENY